jgi:papain like protease
MAVRAHSIAAALLVLAPALAKADVDWRSKGVVTPVKNQGQLCASWAFAVTGVVEGAYAIQNGILSSLSEQQLVDCASPNCGGANGDTCACAQIGCFFGYVQANGECRASSYPYTARVGSCQTTCSPVIPSGFASNWQRLGGGDPGLIAGLNQGPILARLEVGDHGQTLAAFSNYSGGVFPATTADATVVQWVLIVGYTSSYFIVKNSFGTSWGANGYLFLARGSNNLGVYNYAYGLQAGAASAGACALPGGGCAEMSEADCTAAGGSFDSVGTFCPTTCVSATAAAAPAASNTALMAMLAVLVGAAFVALRLRRRV